MFDYSRLYNSAGSNASRSQLIHPILMSINIRTLQAIREIAKIGCKIRVNYLFSFVDRVYI